MIEGQNILITGCTGFLGRHLVTALMKSNFVVGIYNSESKYAHLKRNNDLKNCKFYKINISNIHDLSDNLENIFRTHQIDYVYHSAAMKHVDICEENPIDAMNTNFYATDILVKISLKYNVKNLIALTTDKSIEPCNVYGYSKLLMQQLVLKNGYSVYQGANFFWSDGSVLDIWMDQKKMNLPLSITDFKHVRYFNHIKYVVDILIRNIDNKNTTVLPDYVFKMSLENLFNAFCIYFKYNNIKYINFTNEKSIESIDNTIKRIYSLDTQNIVDLIDCCYTDKSYDDYLKIINEFNIKNN